MHMGNVNLSLNSISLIIDVQSCLEGKEYHSIEWFYNKYTDRIKTMCLISV